MFGSSRTMTPMPDWTEPHQTAFASGTKTVEKPQTDTVAKLASPWNVIVLDDPVTTMVYVVRVFRDVFSYGETKAHRLMMEVHSTGRSVVWTGDREQAELFVHKLHGKHLLAHLEQSGAD